MNGASPNGASQPPRNRIVVIALIRIMLAYSPRKNSAKLIDAVFDEEAGDDLALAFRQVERRAVGLRQGRDEEHDEHREQRDAEPDMVCCASTMSVRFRLPTHEQHA